MAFIVGPMGVAVGVKVMVGVEVIVGVGVLAAVGVLLPQEQCSRVSREVMVKRQMQNIFLMNMT